VSLADTFTKIANAHLARISAELGDAIESVRAEHRTEPLESIRTALRARTDLIEGVSMSEDQLTEYAQAIADDAEIAVEFTPLRDRGSREP
jgi:hypothetical protein